MNIDEQEKITDAEKDFEGVKRDVAEHVSERVAVSKSKTVQKSEDAAPVDNPGTSSNDTNTEKETDTDALPDELIERAIRAGMSLSEIDDIPESALEKILSKLEGTSQTTNDSNAGGKEENKETKTPQSEDRDKGYVDLTKVDDLDEGEEYDEHVVSNFNHLRDRIKTLESLVDQLSEGLKTQETQSTLSELNIPKDKLGEVQKKFNILKKAYADSEEEISDADVAKEAMQLVGVTSEAKRTAMTRRTQQSVQRPTSKEGGNTVNSVNEKVVDMLNQRIAEMTR